MIGRFVNAPLSRCLPVRLLLALVVVTPFTFTACKKKEKPFPPAPQLLTTAALDANDAGLVAIPASALAAPADTMNPADRSALEQVKASVSELESMVKRNVFTDPDKPGQGDANAVCQAIETPLARVEALEDPEAKKLVNDSKRLCSLDVPMLSADRTLKQVSISPSQASRQLMCKFASKDLEKARATKGGGQRLRDLDARFARACR